jgi:hypothetical protein
MNSLLKHLSQLLIQHTDQPFSWPQTPISFYQQISIWIFMFKVSWSWHPPKSVLVLSAEMFTIL